MVMHGPVPSGKYRNARHTIIISALPMRLLIAWAVRRGVTCVHVRGFGHRGEFRRLCRERLVLLSSGYLRVLPGFFDLLCQL